MDAVRRITLLAAGLALAAGAVIACSSSSSTPATDTDAGDDDSGAPSLPDASKSICGHPGDKGNSLGVGKFCQQSSDCSDNTRATLCTTIADDTAFFCTFVCHADAGDEQCGENAECQCQGGSGCGCFPKACDTSSSDAGTDAAEDAPADAPSDG